MVSNAGAAKQPLPLTIRASWAMIAKHRCSLNQVGSPAHWLEIEIEGGISAPNSLSHNAQFESWDQSMFVCFSFRAPLPPPLGKESIEALSYLAC